MASLLFACHGNMIPIRRDASLPKSTGCVRKIERKKRGVKDKGMKTQLIQWELKHAIEEMAEMAWPKTG
jgi:hypothetical protein